MSVPSTLPAVARRLCARGLVGYAEALARTSRISIGQGGDSLPATLWDGVPTVLVGWHDEFLNVPLVLMPYLTDARKRRGATADVTYVTNDTFAGQFIAEAGTDMGATLLTMKRTDDREAKLRVLEEGFHRTGGLLIAADYGRPWFRARPTAWDLAKNAGGCIVAFHVETSPSIAIGSNAHRGYLPVPFARYRVHFSPPQFPSSASAAPMEAVTEWLWALRGSHAKRR